MLIKNQINFLLPLISVFLLLSASCTQKGGDVDSAENTTTESHISKKSKSTAVYEDESSFEENSNSEQNYKIYVDFIDSDSIPDSIFVEEPKINYADAGDFSQDCNGPCVTEILFGNLIPPIFVQQSIGGNLRVLDDINENGFKEIAFFPNWFQSCWSRIDIFSYNGSDWKHIRSIDYNSCEESLPTSFEKLGKGMLRVITNGEQFEENTANEVDGTTSELPGLEVKIYDVEIK